MTRNSVVLPACVGPSSTLSEPVSSVRSRPYKYGSAPTRRLTCSSVSAIADLCFSLFVHERGQRSGERGRGVRRRAQSELGAPPQNVLRRPRPLMLYEVIDLRL